MTTKRDGGLTELQIERFHRDGFIGPLPKFCEEALIDEVHLSCLEAVNNPHPHPIYGRYSVRDWHLVFSRMEEFLTHPVLVDVLRSLIGNDLVLWRSKIFYKKTNERGTGWHQEWGDFDGEEIGNCKPSLRPQNRENNWWNITVWVALTDVELECAPLRFIRGSHKKKYPKKMVPMPQSEFWHDPFIGCKSVADIVDRARNLTLVLDVDTSKIFEGVDVSRYTLEEAKEHVRCHLEKFPAKKTLGIDESKEDIVTLPMKRGEFVVFTERTMHGSLSNLSNKDRLAVNFRVTTTDTDIYPSRHQGDFIDGSNLDITKHENLLLSGEDLSLGRNKYRLGKRR